MFDSTIEPTDSAYAEVTRRLEAYADLRLSPSASSTTRMRTNVMNAAHRRAALIEADATIGAGDQAVPALAARHARVTRLGWHRPVAAAFAACLTLGVVTGSTFAAQPGGPLYAARMWTEMVTLPSGVVARAQAEVARLEERLAEAQSASNAGDSGAAQAALAAYTQIVSEAADASAGDPTAVAAIEESVNRHVSVLTLLATTVPTTARGALDQALSSSTKVLHDLATPGSSGSHPDNGNGNGNVGGDPGGGANPPTPTGTPKPHPTPKPTDPPAGPPAPGENPNPDKTAKPDKTTNPGQAHASTKPTDGHDTNDPHGP